MLLSIVPPVSTEPAVSSDPSLHPPCAALHGVLLGVLFGGPT